MHQTAVAPTRDRVAPLPPLTTTEEYLQPTSEPRHGEPPALVALETETLRAALNAVEQEAVVLTAHGQIVIVNDAASHLAHLPSSELIRLAHDAYDGRGPYLVTVLPRLSDGPQYYLLRKAKPRLAMDMLHRRAKDWGLTRRQRETLGCLVKGMCNKMIAKELNCAVRTVELHVSAVLRAAGVGSRSEAIAAFWSDLA